MSVDQDIRDSLHAAMRQQADAHLVRPPSVESVRARAVRQARRSGALAVATVAAVTLVVVVAGGLALTGRLHSQQQVITPSSPTPTASHTKNPAFPPFALSMNRTWYSSGARRDVARGLADDPQFAALTAQQQSAVTTPYGTPARFVNVVLQIGRNDCRLLALNLAGDPGKALGSAGFPNSHLVERGRCEYSPPADWSPASRSWVGGTLVIHHDTGTGSSWDDRFAAAEPYPRRHLLSLDAALQLALVSTGRPARDGLPGALWSKAYYTSSWFVAQ